MLHLRESVVCLGEELEQSAETGARERENRQRLHEMEDLAQREQDSSRRRIELVTHTHNKLIVQNIKNTFLILSCTPAFCPQNSLN